MRNATSPACSCLYPVFVAALFPFDGGIAAERFLELSGGPHLLGPITLGTRPLFMDHLTKMVPMGDKKGRAFMMLRR